MDLQRCLARLEGLGFSIAASDVLPPNCSACGGQKGLEMGVASVAYSRVESFHFEEVSVSVLWCH